VTLLSSARARVGRADLLAAGAALGLVAAALVLGFALDLRLTWPTTDAGPITMFGEWPVLGQWWPHTGPGTPFAVLIAAAAVTWGPALAARLPWRACLAAGYALAVAWTVALAMVDGWRDGVAGRLTRGDEYLAEVGGITDIGAMLRSFTARILDYQPDSWVTHVSGHPPGATLVFVWLDRVGLSGGAAAGVVCVLAGAAAAVAVPVTISALGCPSAARAALPFVALFPGAVWVGVSADGLFTGVTATGVALLAVGAGGNGRQGGRVRAAAACAGGGLLLGFGAFLSYGLVLLGGLAVAVVALAARANGAAAWRALVPAGLAALSVLGAFAVSGFWWLDGYHLVVARYYQGIALVRPYGYWVWANLASLALAVGPATAVGLRRAAVGLTRPDGRTALVILVAVASAVVLAADVSGLSKAEVERIWLPFAVWLVAAAALVPAPTRRWWLAGQAATALVVNHLLLTGW